MGATFLTHHFHFLYTIFFITSMNIHHTSHQCHFSNNFSKGIHPPCNSLKTLLTTLIPGVNTQGKEPLLNELSDHL